MHEFSTVTPLDSSAPQQQEQEYEMIEILDLNDHETIVNMNDNDNRSSSSDNNDGTIPFVIPVMTDAFTRVSSPHNQSFSNTFTPTTNTNANTTTDTNTNTTITRATQNHQYQSFTMGSVQPITTIENKNNNKQTTTIARKRTRPIHEQPLESLIKQMKLQSFSSRKMQLMHDMFHLPIASSTTPTDIEDDDNGESTDYYYSMTYSQMKQLLDQFLVSLEKKQVLLDYLDCVETNDTNNGLAALLESFDWDVDRQHVQSLIQTQYNKNLL